MLEYPLLVFRNYIIPERSSSLNPHLVQSFHFKDGETGSEK